MAVMLMAPDRTVACWTVVAGSWYSCTRKKLELLYRWCMVVLVEGEQSESLSALLDSHTLIRMRIIASRREPNGEREVNDTVSRQCTAVNI
eukprot:7379008-Prymnesium_polylepis.1